MPSPHRLLIKDKRRHTVTDDDSEEDNSSDDDVGFSYDDDELDEEERLLQQTILRNFMGRNRNANLHSLKAKKVADDDDDACFVRRLSTNNP